MSKSDIIKCYNATSAAYADALFDELSHKHLDRVLLNQFAFENKSKGIMIDLGCGPGQTTRFLADAGITDILGTDLSPGMISKAKELSPALQFETADMLALKYANRSFASAVAFYAIVHFTQHEVETCFAEVNRILQPGGQFLLSFHIGDETIHRDELFGVAVDIDFYFFKTETIIQFLKDTGFKLVDAVERSPYPDVEHPSKRAYLLAAKI